MSSTIDRQVFRIYIFYAVQIEFDPAKDAENRIKHGVSLRSAADFELNDAVIVEDDRQDYGEVRYVAVGRLRRSLHTLVFTYRGSVIRAISLRYANKNERVFYHASR